MNKKKNGPDGQDDDSKSAFEWAKLIHPGAPAGAGTDKPGPQQKGSVDKVPQAMEGTLAAVAASIIYSASGMSRWGPAEATLGLYKLYCRHVNEGVIDTINGSLVNSVTEIQELAHWIVWASAAYHSTVKPCAEELQVQEDCIVKIFETSAIGQPAYLIGLDHPKKAVVLSIRGTFSALDVLTDLTPHSERFENGHAHSGMLTSSKWLRDSVSDILKDLMGIHEYRLVLTGHSLGAGTAALVTLLLREPKDKGLTVLGVKPEEVTCWGYCCPPCVDRTLAEQSTFIRCVIHQDDIVARITPAAVEDLRTEILQTDWSHALEDGSKRKLAVELAETSVTLFDRLGPALNLNKDEMMVKAKEQGLTSLKGWTDSLASRWLNQGTAEGGQGGQDAQGGQGNQGGQDGEDGQGAQSAQSAQSSRYGAGAKKLAGLFSAGALTAGAQFSAIGKEVADSMHEAIMEQMALIDNNGKASAITQKASSTSKDTVATGAKDTNEARKDKSDPSVGERLFVPGILYHVIRRPLRPGEKLPDDLQSDNEEVPKDGQSDEDSPSNPQSDEKVLKEGQSDEVLPSNPQSDEKALKDPQSDEKEPKGSSQFKAGALSVLGTSWFSKKDKPPKEKPPAKQNKPRKKRPPSRAMIVRGDDRSSRFRRIVLSPTFVKDHLCPGLQAALTDALKWEQSSER